MSNTRNFDETVLERIQTDPKFADILLGQYKTLIGFSESIRAMTIAIAKSDPEFAVQLYDELLQIVFNGEDK